MHHGICLVFFVAGGLAMADPPGSGTEEVTTLYGVVRDVSANGAGLQVQSRKGIWEVEWGSPLTIVQHEVKPLATVAVGTHLHILGRRQKSQPTRGGGEYPPRLISVVAIVAAPEGGYNAPPVTIDPRQRGLKWHRGVLLKQKKTRLLDGAELMVGDDHPVLFFERKVTKEAVEKRQRVLLLGRASGEDKKKRLRAQEAIILAPDLKKKDYAAIVDFTGEVWPTPRKDQKRKGKAGGRPDF